jgi:Domain of unknown function (DUF4440)
MTEDVTGAVLAAEERRCRAMLANDVQTLAGLIDDELHFSHATGSVDNKEAYLAKVAAGRIVYSSIQWSEEKVLSLGEAALLMGRMTSVVRVDGKEKQLDNRVLAAWKHDGCWRLLAFQSTPLAG